MNFLSIVNERRASFHLGGNDDDLSNDSPPKTSPMPSESLKRVSRINTHRRLLEYECCLFVRIKQDSSLTKLANDSALKKENFLKLAEKAAHTSASSSTVKPDDKVAQDRFMQFQKQAKLKAEQVKLFAIIFSSVHIR